MRPQDARRSLRNLWHFVEVVSCSDGSIKIRPKWRDHHGLLTRLAAARMVGDALKVKK